MNDQLAPIVSPEAVGTRLGLPLPLAASVAARITEAIDAAEGKVLGYLNRESLHAVEVTLPYLMPAPGWPMTDKRAWPQVKSYLNDRFRVVSSTVTDDGDGFSVVFSVGLDVANDPELKSIKTYLLEDAAAQLIADPDFASVARRVTSVSADGQSVSYDKAPTGEAAGSGATITSLRRWRRLSIVHPTSPQSAPWPYGDRNYW